MSWRTSTADSGLRPSRAMNVDATPEAITAACAKASATISALEPLLSGGTRVVMTNGAGADKMRSVFARKLISGSVERTAWASTRQ